MSLSDPTAYDRRPPSDPLAPHPGDRLVPDDTGTGRASLVPEAPVPATSPTPRPRALLPGPLDAQRHFGNAAVVRATGARTRARTGAIDEAKAEEAEHEADQAARAPHAAREVSPAPGDGVVPPDVAAALGESGQPLDARTRRRMERALRARFADVRVHTGPAAARSARDRDAQAYAFAQHVVFAEGRYLPGTPAGDLLLRHELTHVVQQRRGRPLVQRQPDPSKKPDPRPALTNLDEDDVVEPLGPEPPDELVDEGQARIFLSSTSSHWPGIVFVPNWASRAEIAKNVLGNEALEKEFSFVSQEELVGRKAKDDRGIRPRNPSALPADLLAEMRAAFEFQLDQDVDWTMTELLRSSSSGRDLAERVMRWGDYATWTDASGVSYFERYLKALEARSITVTKRFWALGWHTYGTVKRNGLEQILSETEGSYHEMVLKAITLRSSRDVGYKVYDTPAGDVFLRRGAIIGRWFSANDKATATLHVLEPLAYSMDRREAEIRTRNAPWPSHKVLIPAGAGWAGYSLLVHPDLASLLPPVPGLEEGRWHWYYPTVDYIGPSELLNPQAWTPPPTSDPHAFEHALVLEALIKAATAGRDALYGLDFGALALAKINERARIFEHVLAKPLAGERAAVDLLMRTVLTTPSADFPKLAAALDAQGSIQKLLQVKDPKLAQLLLGLGQAFTLQSLQSMPLGGAAFKESTVLVRDSIASGNGGWYYTAESKPVTVRVVPPEKWDPDATITAAGGQAMEPGPPGSTEHDVTRTGIEFTVGTFPAGGWGDTAKRLSVVSKTRVFLPYELVTLETSSKKDRSRRIVSALEASLLQGNPKEELDDRSFADFMDVVLIAQATFGIARLGGIALRAAAAGSLRAGVTLLASELTSVAGRAAGRSLVDVALLGAAKYAMENQEELSKTEEGRAFLAVLTAVTALLALRDVGHLVKSGAITKLWEAGQLLLGKVKGAAQASVRRSMLTFRAAQIAWKDLHEAGELVAITNAAGLRVMVPRSPGHFMTAFRRAEAAAAREAFQASVATSKGGAAAAAKGDTALAKLHQAAGLKLKDGKLVRAGKGDLTALEKEAERAYRDVMRHAATLPAAEATKLFDAIADTIKNVKGYGVAELSSFFRAAVSGKHGDVAVFLGNVKWLATQNLTKEGFAVLGRKTLSRPKAVPLDLAWLRKTVEQNGMTKADLDFLARDPNTPWNTFKQASLNPTKDWSIKANMSVRGIAAEMVTLGEGKSLVGGYRIHARQADLDGGSRIDYVLRSTDGRAAKRGLEVKGYIADTWDEAIEGFLKGKTGKDEPGRKIKNMLKQLEDAKNQPRFERPVLAVTDAMKDATRAKLDGILSSKFGPRGVKVVELSDTDILEAGRRLRKSLGLP